jgi:hypothetical protein
MLYHRSVKGRGRSMNILKQPPSLVWFSQVLVWSDLVSKVALSNLRELISPVKDREAASLLGSRHADWLNGRR